MLLFDEPLSNLDAKLRERVRFELVELQKKLKIPAIYVTHDQAEALVISDRIAVMNRGRIEQIGTPYEIYKRPKTPFVADFIGISNFLEGRVVGVDNEKGIATVEIKEGISLEGFLSRNVHKGSKAIISIRPENIRLAQKEGVNVVESKVVKKTFLGDSYDYRLVLGDIELRMKTGPEVELEVGQIVKVELKECIVFPKERR
jgi:iron(III) transport system ATP-binding protein